MMRSRTRHNLKQAAQFLKEAGLNSEPEALENEKVTPAKKQLLTLKKKCKASMNIEQNNFEKEMPQLNSKSKLEDQTKSEAKEAVCEPTAEVRLEKIIRKPNYVHIEKNKVITGSFGHSTSVFKRPVLEGSFYIEFKILQDSKPKWPTSHPSSVRIGIAPFNYDEATPLGTAQSIALRSYDGQIIRNSSFQKFSSSFRVEDVVGVGLQISPPPKYPNKDQIAEDCTVSFYKNGQMVGKCSELKQQFYCFAVSLYNYAQVEVMMTPSSISAVPSNFRPYSETFAMKIPYKSIQNSKAFNS